MSFEVVAKKEFTDAIRSNVLIAITVLFFLLSALIIAVYVFVDSFQAASATDLIQSLTSGATWFVPILAIILTYKAIVGERTSGSLALMLSLPHTRSDVYLGKFIGRSGVLLAAILAAFLGGGIVMVYEFGLSGVATFLGYMVFIMLLGLVYVSVGLALSGATNSSTLAAIGSFGLLALFKLWTAIITVGLTILAFVLDKVGIDVASSLEGNQESASAFIDFLLLINPHIGYSFAVEQFVYGQELGSTTFLAGAFITAGDPWYASPYVGLFVIFVWIAVPAALGYLRFESVDL
jgi:ABC-2 type transport system permease protein